MGALVGSDAAIVEQMVAGDPSGLAALYDRYADRIHTMSSHMLRDPDEAADVTADVFLVAAERIGQLRDPDKVKQWLFAITRNEVYRRTRRRGRTVLVGDVETAVLGGAAGSSVVDLTDGDGGEPDGTDPAEAAALVREAAAGLDDRDRMVLELHLAQGLDGTELAEALGVKVDHAYQLTHRMKERLERSLGALLVGRAGRAGCADLESVTARWDGHFDVLWRKRLARHADGCERCGALRSKLPAAVLAGAGAALFAGQSAMAAPAGVREQVLARGAARLGSASGRAWPGDGFPPAVVRAGRRRLGLLLGGLLVAGVCLVVLGGGLGAGDDPVVVDAPAGPVTSSPGVPSTAPVGPPTSPVGPSVPSTAAPSATAPSTVDPSAPPTSPGGPGAPAAGGGPSTTPPAATGGPSTTAAVTGGTAPNGTSGAPTTTTTVRPVTPGCATAVAVVCGGGRTTTTTTVAPPPVLVPVQPRPPFPFRTTTTLPRIFGPRPTFRPPPTIG